MQNYFSSEFLASGLSAEFNDFITRITQAKSKTVRKGRCEYWFAMC